MTTLFIPSKNYLRMTEETPTLEDLTKEIDLTSWSELEIHEKRSGLILVDSTLSLAEVALKVANDDAESVKSWMAKNLILRPTETQITSFKENPAHKQFSFLIVQPYVLAQINTDA
jgi:hypothetical protein